MKRDDLLRPYQRPFRHAVGHAWAHQAELRRATALLVVLLLVAVGGVVADVALIAVLAGLGALFAARVLVLWLFASARTARRWVRAWEQSSDLAAVRARRPQAHEHDRQLAHDEFAVTVDESGWLVTWRFRPLAITEEPRAGELAVPGRPRYAASPVDQCAFDGEDTARAAEQLVVAQERAAEREAAAQAAVLEPDVKSTAAALRRITGQD